VTKKNCGKIFWLGHTSLRRWSGISIVLSIKPPTAEMASRQKYFLPYLPLLAHRQDSRRLLLSPSRVNSRGIVGSLEQSLYFLNRSTGIDRVDHRVAIRAYRS